MIDINSRICYMPSMGGGGSAGGDNDDGSDSSGGNTGGMGDSGSSSSSSGGGGDGGLGSLGLGGYGSNDGQIDGSIDANGNGFSGFDGDGNELGNGNGYVDGWASEVYDAVQSQVDTTVSINTNLNGSTDFYGDIKGWGFLNDVTAYQDASGSTVNGSAISAGLMNLGISASTSIAVEALAEVAISIALSAPLSAIAPTAKALQAKGVINEKTSKTLQAVGLVASFMKGTISNLQALDSINTAKQYGAINDMQVAVMGALTAYSQYNMTTNLMDSIDDLNLSTALNDMSDFGFSTSGDGLYLNGTLVTSSNFASTTSSFISYLTSQTSSVDTSYNKMAGSLFWNNYLAGGDLWNPLNIIGGSLEASVNKSMKFPQVVQMLELQENYAGSILNPYAKIEAMFS